MSASVNLPGTASSGEDPVLAELIEDITNRLQAGEHVDLETYVADHPEHARQLRDLLPALHVLAALSGPAGEGAPPAGDAGPDHGTLGDFRILREVGRGGMGVVYEAEQLSLKRRVALKVLPLASILDERRLRRFQNEAQAAAGLHHTHIVPVYFVGCERGVHFYAMQFIDGQPLSEVIARLREERRGTTGGTEPAGKAVAAKSPDGQPPPAEAAATSPTAQPDGNRTPLTGEGGRSQVYFRTVAELGIQAAEALDHAHQLGVVHRDVKPANLLVDGRGSLWVTDFGLAQVQQGDGGVTMTGDVIGTLRYMSPEQALAKRAVLDHRTDVYSLGATLYELLTLRPVFPGSDRQEVLRQIAFDEPVLLRRLNRAVPAELETVVLKALEKSPAERYATAQELADDLRRWLDDRPIEARRPSWVQRVAKWVRRHRAATVAVLCLFLAAAFAAIAVVSLYLYKGAQSAHELATLKRQMSAQQDVHRHWQEGFDDENAGRLEDARDHFVQALEILDREPDAGERHRIEEARDRVVGRQTMQAGRRDWNDRVDGFAGCQAKVRVYEISLTEGSRDADRALILRAAPAALAQFRLSAEDAPADAARRLEVFRPYAEPRQLEKIAADCYQVLLAWAEAEALPDPNDAAGARRALHLLDQAACLAEAHQLPTPRAYHLQRARCLARAGDQATARAEQQQAAAGKPETVLDLFLRAVESYRRKETAQAAATCAQVLDKEPNHFWALYLQGLCHFQAHRWEAAKGNSTACLSQRPDFFWARLLRATAETQLDEFKAAEGDFAQVLRRAEEPAARWVARTNRGTMWVRQQRWGEAIADFREAIALQPNVPEAYIDLAEAYRGRKDWEAAVQALDKALARRPRDVAGLYHSRAVLDLGRGDSVAARHDLEQAIAHAPPGTTSERLASDHVELGHLAHKAREHEAALASFDKALQIRPDYPPAYRQRAETLLALGRNEDAGKALDCFLLKGTPTAKAYRVRGQIRAELRQYPEAVDAYSRSLALGQDADTLTYRGWAYLRLGALRPALGDFDAALRLDPAQTEALCGRGYARARLGRLAEAVTDTEASLRCGRPAALLLFDAACTYAVGVGELQARAGGRWTPDGTATRYQERAVDLLRAALDAVPAGKRQDFWRANIHNAPDLVPLRGSTSFLELARGYPR